MSKDPSFPFYASDWLGSNARATMTLEQQGAYLNLLCRQWTDPTCSLPDDDESLANLSGLGEGWLKDGCPMVRVCFPPHPTLRARVANPRLLTVRGERDEWRVKSSLAGQKSGKVRRAKARRNKALERNEPNANQTRTKPRTKHEPNTNSPSPSPSPSPSMYDHLDLSKEAALINVFLLAQEKFGPPLFCHPSQLSNSQKITLLKTAWLLVTKRLSESQVQNGLTALKERGAGPTDDPVAYFATVLKDATKGEYHKLLTSVELPPKLLAAWRDPI